MLRPCRMQHRGEMGRKALVGGGYNPHFAPFKAPQRSRRGEFHSACSGPYVSACLARAAYASGCGVNLISCLRKNLMRLRTVLAGRRVTLPSHGPEYDNRRIMTCVPE